MKPINLKNKNLIIDKSSKEPIIIIQDLTKIDQNELTIHVKENINVSILEVFIHGNSEINLERTFVLENNAKLEYVKYQNIDENTFLNINNNIDLKDSSIFNMVNFELGFGKTNNIYRTSLDSIDTKLNIKGLVKLYEQSTCFSSFETVHNAQSCFSNIAYKHSLHDKTKATFEAISKVNEKAYDSKVLQNSDTILLSDDATIQARPHLEINIDELEASHGATTGSLNKEQLLYLQTRGISKEKAYEILLKAFENEIYDSIQDTKIKDFIENYKGENYV